MIFRVNSLFLYLRLFDCHVGRLEFQVRRAAKQQADEFALASRGRLVEDSPQVRPGRAEAHVKLFGNPLHGRRGKEEISGYEHEIILPPPQAGGAMTK